MTPVYNKDGCTVYHGDCLEVMRSLPENSVDAVVTDPPYGLAPSKNAKSGFMGKKWDAVVPGVEIWQEALRVLRPGGHLLAMGGTRTFHSLVCSIEDAGFEVRDTLCWLNGQGFPKSQNVSAMIDKRGGASIGWFGPWLREERRKRGISSNQLSTYFPSITGQFTGCVRNWELGFNLPTVDQFNTLCEVLDLSFTRLEEAEREVIGKGFSGKTAIWNEEGDMGYFNLTLPSTDTAKQWDGWGTALKPGHELVIWATKPFKVVPEWAIIWELTCIVESLLWCLAPVKLVELCFTLNPQELGGASLDSVRWIVAVLSGIRLRGLSAMTDTFNSPDQASTFLSIVLLWSAILEESSGSQNTFTTETVSNLTTGLKTLSCLISEITPEDTIRDAKSTHGLWWSASTAKGNSSVLFASQGSTPKPSANENVFWNISDGILNALVSIVESTLPRLRVTKDYSASPLVITHTDQRIEPQTPSNTGGLRPDLELICLARKPLSEPTISANVLAHGTGALNIGETCVPISGDRRSPNAADGTVHRTNGSVYGKHQHSDGFDVNQGRWPANVLLSDDPEVQDAFDGFGESKSPSNPVKQGGHHRHDVGLNGSSRNGFGVGYSDSGSPARFFTKLPVDDPNTLRFLYASKANRRDRCGSKHPTIKPQALLRWLSRLITPPGGLILDPFAGSGSLGTAARQEGFRSILIEREAEYIADILRRLEAEPVRPAPSRPRTATQPIPVATQPTFSFEETG